jgi:hypothetical protein
VEPLRCLVRAGPQPLARVHAAWLLNALDALDADLVLHLLEDANPRVREHAVRLAEKWLAGNQSLQEHVIALAADPDARLRFQVALSLGA